jgi:phosphoglycerol transferase MdoB-like AlkP superfamily enzyme
LSDIIIRIKKQVLFYKGSEFVTRFSDNSIVRFFKSFFSFVQKIDTLCLKYKIYQWISILLFAIITILLLNSYDITETKANYTNQSTNSIRLNQSTPVSFAFDAYSKNLGSFRLYKDVENTHLDSSDKASVIITSSDGDVVLSTEVYLYNPSRNYVLVNCGDVSLERGKTYTVTFQITELANGSTFYLKTHESNTFGLITSGPTLGDLPLGIGLVPNVSFAYSVVSYLHMLPHLVLFFLLLACLFVPRIINRRWVKEVYRGGLICILIYLTQEILNISRSDPMQMLFPLTVHHYFILFAGLLIIILFYLLFYAFTGSGTAAIIITAVLALMAGYVNHMKMVMRGDPAMPWDLFSAGMAAKITTKYKFQISTRFVVSIFMVVMILLLIRLTHTPYVRGLKKRIFAVLGSSLLFSGLVFGVILNPTLLADMDVSYSLFPPLQSYSENGTMLALALQLNHLKVSGSENNSVDATKDVIASYVEQVNSENLNKTAVSNAKIKPNVICIMNESFSELNEIRDIQTSEAVTPFFDSLKKESLYGDLAVSIFGGGTSNTEFEFLTGYSVRGLIAGSSVYNFYVNHSLDALPQIFKDQGYSTEAIHPFDPEWWGRAEAYPLLGFDQFISEKDFINPSLVREYISDKSAYERVISEYQKKGKDTPQFTFLVTMQNHADYTEYWDNQAYNIKITNFPDNSFPCTEHYFSLLRESDDALKELITYFKSVDEPTIIVLFGDHKPFLDSDLYSTLLGENLSKITAKESLPLYTTPYLIWANYDIQKGNAGITSPNFLGQTVLDLAGIPSPDERACLRVLQTKISAISAPAIYDKLGNTYTLDDVLPDSLSKIINDYEFIQYGKLFLDNSATASSVSSSAG